MNPAWLFFAGLLALGASAPVGPYNRNQYGAGPNYRSHQGATSTSESYGYQSSTTSHSGSHAPQGGRPYGAGHIPSGRYGPAAPVPPPRAGGHYGAPAAPAGRYGAPAAPAGHYRAPAAPAGHYGRPSAPGRPQQPSRPHGPSAPSYRAPAAGPSHYGAGVGQQHRQPSGNRYGAPAHGGVSHGREMKYTIQDPYKGTTHVTETHIVSNKEMHGAEAEAAMKHLMGSMGPSSYGPSGGFHQIANGIGLPFY